MSEPSPVSLRALALQKQAVADGVRGGVKPWAKFRGPVVDGYQRSVHLPISPDPTVPGNPWCIAEVFFNHRQGAADLGQPHFCPQTASTVHAVDSAPEHCILDAPQPGATGILIRADGKHGHAVMCEVVNDDGTILTHEGDTANEATSSTGDSCGSHTWDPMFPGKRGFVAVHWFDFGLAPPLTAA